MEERFLAVNKQSRTMMIGVWKDVCDLDKRTWNVAPFDAEEKEPEPLAYIEVVTKYEPSGVIEKTQYQEIYSHHELVGVYV